jgi:hypothetical protein
LRKANLWHEHSKELHEQLKGTSPIFTSEKTDHLNYLNQFVSNLFIEEKAPYTISSWLSNNLLYSYGEVDMILYPSSLTDSYFTNFAIHPNFSDRYLQLKCVFQFSVNDITSKKLDYWNPE